MWNKKNQGSEFFPHTMSGSEQYISQMNNEKSGRSLRIRLRFLRGSLVVFFIWICFRLIQIQIIESERIRKVAQEQYRSRIDLPATRGSIYDRNGNVLASNSMFVSFAADPKLAAEDAQAIAAEFSSLFGKPKKYYIEKLRSDSRFVWLERQVHLDYLKKVDLQKLDGIVVRYEPKRLYHHDQVAGQLIGCTSRDNNGLAGVEQAFDKKLQGTDGYVVFQRDGLGRARPTVDYPRVEPTNGDNVYLTIDIGLQSIVEEELKKGITQNKAESGIVVLLQPKTGEILAMAQYPNVDPNNFGAYDLKDQKLRAITDMFEPGSVFKLVTASAALEHKIVAPSRRFFAENGEYYVPMASGKPRKISDVHQYGWLTFQEAVELSSNIVMAKVSDLIGSERMYKMARDYGFGITTNIEIPGEVKGNLKKPVDWSGTTLNTIAFGYEVSATPLQIAVAYAAIANNGTLMKPLIFKKEVDAAGQVVSESRPQQIRKVTSIETARILKDFFTGVVQRGTGKPANIPGITVAGKTGTSRKFVESHYEAGSYTASFVGFFPVEDPQIVCLVMMDNPHGASYTGGTTSAPVFRAIAERVINTSDMFAPLSPATHILAKSLERSAVPLKKSLETLRDSVYTTTNVVLETNQIDSSNTGYVVPDVRGYSVRRAVSVLTTKKLEPVVNGSGTVIRQAPSAGQPVKAGMKITLICQPKSLISLIAN
jgi:cell division protein FtsI (penicillin-binding protein 3)